MQFLDTSTYSDQVYHEELKAIEKMLGVADLQLYFLSAFNEESRRMASKTKKPDQTNQKRKSWAGTPTGLTMVLESISVGTGYSLNQRLTLASKLGRVLAAVKDGDPQMVLELVSSLGQTHQSLMKIPFLIDFCFHPIERSCRVTAETVCVSGASIAHLCAFLKQWECVKALGPCISIEGGTEVRFNQDPFGPSTPSVFDMKK